MAMKELDIDLTRELEDGISIFALKGTLGIEGADGLSQLFNACLKEGHTRLVLNFKEVDFISSAAMGVLLSSVGDFRKKNGDIVLINLPNRVKKVFKSLDVMDYFRIFNNEEDAVKALRDGLPEELVAEEEEEELYMRENISIYLNVMTNILQSISDFRPLNETIELALNTLKDQLSIEDLLFIPISAYLKGIVEHISAGEGYLSSLNTKEMENISKLSLLKKSIIEASELGEDYENEHLCLLKVDCEIIIPIISNRKLDAILLLGRRELGAEYKANDIAMLDTISRLIALAIRLDSFKAEADTTETKEKLAELNAELERRVQELETLYIATRELSSSIELTEILRKFLIITVGQLGTDRAIIYLIKKDEGKFVYKNHRGDISEELRNMTFKEDSHFVEALLKETDLIKIDEARSLFSPKQIELLRRDKIDLIVGIKFKKKLLGFVFIGEKVTGKDYSEDEANMIFSLSLQLGINISNSELFDELREAFNGTIRALIFSLEARDPFTRGHSENVTRLALRLGENIGLGKEAMKNLLIGSILHDIGKIGVSEYVLKKMGSYTREEEKEMQKHVTLGYNLLKKVKLPQKVLDIVRYHHERVDGKGYPDGLKGDEIPIEAKIVSICNSYSSMISKRRHRDALPKSKALEVLINEKGKQFDPELVDKFVKMISEDNENIE